MINSLLSLRALSYTQLNVAQVILLVSARRSSHFTILCRIVQKANAFAPIWSKKEVCSGALLAHCYFEEMKIYCAIDQLKPSLKSMTQYFFWLFKERVSRKCASVRVHNARSHCLLHTGMRISTQTCQIF